MKQPVRKYASVGCEYLAYLVVRAMICVVQAVPVSVSNSTAQIFAYLLTYIFPVRGKVIQENLKIAFPDLTRAESLNQTYRMWHSLILMIIEITLTPRKVHRTNWATVAKIPNSQEIVRNLISTRPTVVITGHYGNFEIGGFVLGMFGFPTYTVARPLENRFLNDYLNEFRSSTGQFMLPKEGSADKIDEIMKGGGTLTLLGDQAAGPKGCKIDFFGKKASTHKAVSLFSLGNNAPMLVVSTRRLGEPFRFEIGLHGVADPLQDGFEYGSIPLLAQWYTRRLEECVSLAPEQYWWLHRRWKGAMTRSEIKKQQREVSQKAA